jgi:hypothetical protein
MNIKDFGAEARLVMVKGRRLKHISSIYHWVNIPRDLPHCPLEFTRVDRPIMFGHVILLPTLNQPFAGQRLII